MAATIETIETLEQATGTYKYGFVTDIESDKAPKGLNEDIIRFISAKKDEPEWMLEWRLKAAVWQEMESPDWAKLDIPPINYQDAYYYAAPKTSDGPASPDEADPELLRTYGKLGIPISEQSFLPVLLRLTRCLTRYQSPLHFAMNWRKLALFSPDFKAIREYPDLIKTYMGSVVPVADNYFSALNAAVFTDGSFVYIPRGVRCPMELSTYFRSMNKTPDNLNVLIIAEDHSVSYLEGCTAPQRDENQLHAAVVELVAMQDAEIKYSTVQNGTGDENGKGGIYNFVTKRGACRGDRSKFLGHRSKPGQQLHGNIHPVFCRARLRWRILFSCAHQ